MFQFNDRMIEISRPTERLIVERIRKGENGRN